MSSSAFTTMFGMPPAKSQRPPLPAETPNNEVIIDVPGHVMRLHYERGTSPFFFKVKKLSESRVTLTLLHTDKGNVDLILSQAECDAVFDPSLETAPLVGHAHFGNLFSREVRGKVSADVWRQALWRLTLKKDDSERMAELTMYPPVGTSEIDVTTDAAPSCEFFDDDFEGESDYLRERLALLKSSYGFAPGQPAMALSIQTYQFLFDLFDHVNPFQPTWSIDSDAQCVVIKTQIGTTSETRVEVQVANWGSDVPFPCCMTRLHKALLHDQVKRLVIHRVEDEKTYRVACISAEGSVLHDVCIEAVKTQGPTLDRSSLSSEIVRHTMLAVMRDDGNDVPTKRTLLVKLKNTVPGDPDITKMHKDQLIKEIDANLAKLEL